MQKKSAKSKEIGLQEDLVNSPHHYTVGGIEAIDYMKAKASPEEFAGYLRLSALKYLSRAGHKDNTLQEYKKAAWFLTRLIKEMEERSETDNRRL